MVGPDAPPTHTLTNNMDWLMVMAARSSLPSDTGDNGVI